MKLTHSLVTAGAITVAAYIGVTAYGNYQVSLQPGKSLPVVVGTPAPAPNRVTIVENPAVEVKAVPITQTTQVAPKATPVPYVWHPIVFPAAPVIVPPHIEFSPPPLPISTPRCGGYVTANGVVACNP